MPLQSCAVCSLRVGTRRVDRKPNPQPKHLRQCRRRVSRSVRFRRTYLRRQVYLIPRFWQTLRSACKRIATKKRIDLTRGPVRAANACAKSHYGHSSTAHDRQGRLVLVSPVERLRRVCRPKSATGVFPEPLPAVCLPARLVLGSHRHERSSYLFRLHAHAT